MTTTFDLKRATIKLKDGTSPTPQELSVVMGEGNLTLGIKMPREYLKDRGRLDAVRDGDEEPMDVSIEGRWQYLKGDGADTLYEILTHTGAATDWVSTDANLCNSYALDLEILFTPSCSADKTETITIPDFRPESIDLDAKAATMSIKGRANVVRPTLARTSQ